MLKIRTCKMSIAIIYILFEFILIISYMHKMMWAGLVAWGVISLCCIRLAKKDMVNALVMLLISSIPVSYLEITCEIGSHILKLFNFCIVFLAVVFFQKKDSRYVDKKIWGILFGILGLQLVRNMMLIATSKEILVELVQEWIIVIPLWLFIEYRRKESRTHTLYNQSVLWKEIYLFMCVATSIGVLYQFYLFKLGIEVGFITEFPARTVYNITFTGFSVLSALLGGGAVISFEYILNRKGILYYFSLGICLLACVINSSRSGLYAAFLVFFLMILQWKGHDAVKRKLMWGIVAIFGGVVVLSLLAQTRLEALFSSNGRVEDIQVGWSIMTSNLSVFLFGVGMQPDMSQHNMLLEMLMKNGLVGLIVFASVLLFILIKNKQSENRYLAWHLLISHQFFTDFFSTTFVLPVFIMLIAGTDSGKRRIINKG